MGCDRKTRRSSDIVKQQSAVVRQGVGNGYVCQVPSQKSHQRHRGVDAAELHWPWALDCVPAVARIASRDSDP